MSTRPYKFLVQAILQETDDDGNVTGEPVLVNEGQPAVFTIFGCSSLAEWAEAFPELLRSLQP